MTIIETTTTTLCGNATTRQVRGAGVGVQDLGLNESGLAMPLRASDAATLDPAVQGRGWTGITCDSTGRLVLGISLPGLGLTGRIPDTIGYLENLTALNLADNALTGTGLHHPALLTLTHLTSLQLQNNRLTGRVSSRIGLLTGLTTLGLSNNRFSGSIPTQIGVLTKLKELDLHSNFFTNNIPAELFHLTLLTKLDLSSNNFNGYLPTQAPVLPFLTHVDMHSAHLRGSIPAIWGTSTLPALVYLDLSNNALTGSLPSTLGRLTRLQYLKLNSNALQHSLPSEVGSLTRLLDLSLEYNRFTAQIPPSIGSLAALYSLTMDNNRFSRTIPSSMTGLTRVVTLTLNSNRLTGSIPSTWGSPHLLHALQLLALNDNSLSKCVPSSFGYLTNLRLLSLQNNELSCTLPAFAFVNLHALYLLNFENNKISGTIPLSFGNMTSLSFLYGKNNPGLGGPLPNTLLGDHAWSLQELDLSSCNLSSSIPPSITAVVSLRSFDVHSNRLTGRLPSSYQPRGKYNVASNKLTGTIPVTFLLNQGLNYLDVSSNFLSGGVPNIYLPWCYVLYLNNNLLSGALTPTSFVGSFGTALLNNNFLTGPLPTYMCQSNLHTLVLSHNKFTSFSNQSLAGACQLQLRTLDVSHNAISSAIPPTLFACSRLALVDLSYNLMQGPVDALLDAAQDPIYQAVTRYLRATLTTLHLEHNLLSGSLPALFYELTSLQGVWMHVNNITGSLSPLVSKLQQLQTLSLYSNQLSSSLPHQLSTVTRLSTLNLRNNAFNHTLSALFPQTAGWLQLATLDLSSNSFCGSLPTQIGGLAALTYLSVERNLLTGSLPSQLSSLSSLSSLYLGNNSYSWMDVGDVTSSLSSSAMWLSTLLARNTLRSLGLDSARVRGVISGALLAAAAKLTYLSLANNGITGAFPSTLGLGMQLQALDLSGNALLAVSSDLCAVASLRRVKLFGGNGGMGCYPDCLVALMGTFSTFVPLCSTHPSGEPTGQPSRQPSGQPSRQPTMQPTMQPTVQPSHVHYDGIFVRLAPYVAPITTLSDQGPCAGQLELFNSTASSTGAGAQAASTHHYAGLGELWCVQYKSSASYRYFGPAELAQSLASRNHSLFVRDGEVSASFNLSHTAVQTLVMRGKGSQWWLHHKSQVATALPLPAAEQAVQPAWEDTLLGCPYFGSEAFGAKSSLPVARRDAWAYGTTAMIQKVRVRAATGMVLNSTNLVGAFLLQKGGLGGGSGHVQIFAAKSDWHESNLTCASTLESKLLPACSGLSQATLSSLADSSALNLTLRSIARHSPVSWTVADVTEITQCQLRQLELSTPPILRPTSVDNFHLSYLWQPVPRSEDVHYSRTHYPLRAAGDVPGDLDRYANESSGMTEWLSSESGDAPLLVVYFLKGVDPTMEPTGQPSRQPSRQPTGQPTGKPTRAADGGLATCHSRCPTGHPTRDPTRQPTRQPTRRPTSQPTGRPTHPTGKPTRQPTGQPTRQPSRQPTGQPSRQPTGQPTGQPTR